MDLPKAFKTLMIAGLLAAAVPALADTSMEAMARALEQVNQRLEVLERQNQMLNARVDELTRQNTALVAANPAPAAPAQAETTKVASSSAPATAADEWASRIRLNGDFRFRHEAIDNAALPSERERESIRARISAAIRITDTIKGEVGFGSGTDPRGGSVTLGAASSRKEIGLDLGYMTWQALDELSITAGKMREPYVRPGRSVFFDNEIRPEGIALNYKDQRGLFGTAFNFWLEERAAMSDSKLRGGQIGWEGDAGALKLKAGAGYYDYVNVQGRFPGFANSLVNEFGNTIVGSGASARYAYDYDIGQAFAEAAWPIAGVPFSVFADYAENLEADNGLDTAYGFGFLAGKASSPGRWEAGVLRQRMEKDALFAHWIDSDFGSGVTDNEGYSWRVAWMPLKNVLLNVTYLDTAFNVDVGTETDYDRWQLDFNFTF